MAEDALIRFVHEALEHLHSRSYLARHPLVTELGVEREPSPADLVRQTLLDAIEQLRPVADAPSYDADRRRYRQLVLRYVEGQTLEQAARVLDISPRQASRDHQQAIAALAGLVEVAGRDRRARLGIPPSARGPDAVDPSDATGLAEEAAKVAASEDGVADLAQSLNGALGLVERLAAGRAVSFVPSLGGALPPVAIGPTLLRQALLNLLVYTCEAAPGQRAILSATDSARGVILRVTVRADESERPGQPPGAISPDSRRLLRAARQLLEAQGGQVEAVDGVGTGTLLRVVLPPVPLREILLVDDNPELAGLFRRYLRDEPYRVIQAVSGARAESLARELHPAVIILDVMIPSQDGWETLQRLRADPETGRTPIVICSVLPEQTLALSLGVDQFLAKPVSRSALLATLQRWCSDPADRAVRSSPTA
ncbi:MAG: response regulator [Chloroflexota bacterium]